MIRQYFILFALFMLLGGCAHQIDTKTTLYDDWKPRLTAQKTWQVEGKLAFISPEARQSANLNWQQTPNANNLILTTFIGMRILSLRQTVNGAELELDGNEYFDTNASALLKRLTGFNLPLENADNWLKGTIDDQNLVVDELGRTKKVLWFDKTGKKWQIDYGTYIQSNGYWLPTRLTLRHQQIKIKIQLYDWQFN